MPHPLHIKVRQIRRLAQRVRWMYGLGWVAAALLASCLVIGLADFLLRSNELGVRLIFTVAVLVATGWALWRFLWPAIRRPAGDLETAQRIEQRWPQLQDRLSSSLEFLAQSEDDATAGSAALRRTVVAEAAAQIDGLPLREAVDGRRPLPVLSVVGVLMLLAGLLYLAAPQAVLQAARRLAAPWSHDPWPRVHHLELVERTSSVPFGEPFRVEVADRGGRLPASVRIYYWFEGQPSAEVQPQSMKPAGERMVHELARVMRPFKFRVAGGDDDTMPWHDVQVVEPPRIRQLTITLHPPAYTGCPKETSSPHIKALSGTKVEVAGHTDKPLASARVVVQTEEEKLEYIAALAADGRRFTLAADAPQPWQLKAAGSYRLLLKGVDGVVGGGGEQYQIDVVADLPPRVSVESPDASAFFTPAAIVPLAASVKDDLAICRIELRYARSDQSDAGEQIIVLYEGPPQAPPRSASPFAAGEAGGEARVVNFNWDLSQLERLPVGASIQFTLAAADYRPQQEQSQPRRITIITPDQLEDRIAQQQTFILGQLAESLEVQRESRSQTQALEIQFGETGQVAPKDAVDLQSAELNQRRVERLLAGEQDGVMAQIDALLNLVRQNRVDNPQIERRLMELRGAVDGIVRQQLPEIQQDLLTGLKAAQNALRSSGDLVVSGPPAQEVRRLVASAGAGQEEAIARLEGLLGSLSQWDNYRRFSRHVSQLRKDQDALSQQTAQLRAQTLSKNLGQLTAQEKAELAKLAQRQVELGRRLERLLTQMDQMGRELQTTDPVAAETLTDAVEGARRAGLSAEMMQAAAQVGSNQLGQAAQSQQMIGSGLDELLDTLTGRREHQLGRQLLKLREAAEELQGLREKQKELRDKFEAASANPDQAQRRRALERLQKERQRQQEEIDRLARRLERLQAERAAQSLARAADHNEQAGQAAQQGDDESERQHSGLAEQELAQAQQQLARQIRQAEQDLLDEQLARLEQALQGMIGQQQHVVTELKRLDELRAAAGSLTRGQLASVRALAQQQRGLVAEASAFAEQIKAAEVFHLGLIRAIDEMNLAAQRLDQAETGPPAQSAAQNARARLQQLLAALQEDASDAPSPESSGGDGGAGGSQGEPPDGIRHLAQLRLLKLMQQSLLDRTNALANARQRQGRLSDDELAELALLVQEQGALAELLDKLRQPPEQESSPELPPDAGDPPNLEEELRRALDGAIDNALDGSERARDLPQPLPGNLPED